MPLIKCAQLQFPQILGDVKHSKDDSDVSGRVDNVLRHDGKGGLEGHIIPRKAQVFGRLPPSPYAHSLPLCPGLS